MDDDARRPTRVWQVDTSIRLCAIVVFLLFVLVAASLTVVGVTLAGALCLWLLAVGVMLFVWRWYLVPDVALTPDRLVVQGPIAHWSLRYAEVTGVRPGGLGLRVETASRGTITAWAVQKSTLSAWLRRDTRADDVVAEISERVRRAAAPSGASSGAAQPGASSGSAASPAP